MNRAALCSAAGSHFYIGSFLKRGEFIRFTCCNYFGFSLVYIVVSKILIQNLSSSNNNLLLRITFKHI